MAGSELTQEEADCLFKMEKFCSDDSSYEFPVLGGYLRIPLKSKDACENFMLDISRGRIELQKYTFQNRAKKTVVLVRLDLGGAPHRNPDGVEIPCPHVHLYREGYDDKWAYPLPEEFSDHANIGNTLEEFLQYCNIIKKPNIQYQEEYANELQGRN
jgi:hypothetical protein